MNIKVIRDKTVRTREIECDVSAIGTQVQELQTLGWSVYDISILDNRDSSASGRATIAATKTLEDTATKKLTSFLE